jgi:hypothetical protein
MDWSLVATLNFAVATRFEGRGLNPQVSEGVDSGPTEHNMKMTRSNPYSGGAPLRVKSMQIKASGRQREKVVSCFCFLVVSVAEVLFQPQIEADEQVAATHFLNLELGDAGSSITPGNRYRRPGVPANDGF